MLLIYTSKKTTRLNYIFRLVFNELLGVEFSFTVDKNEFKEYKGPKLNYSEQVFDDELYIASRKLLFEKGIIEQDFKFVDFEGINVFFHTFKKKSALPFDPFAASFYLLSRYEEYLPYMKDIYGRFDAPESIAFQQGFLHKPVVNIWAQKIKQIIKNKFPEFETNEPNYKFIPTIDIDSAYAYRLKGFIRILGGYFKSLGKFNIPEIIERTKVLMGSIPDPFDTFDYQLELQKKYELDPIYFMLFADYGLNDKNIPTYNRTFQALIKMLGDYADVGIHPSFTSNSVSGKLQKEIRNLSQILNKEITKSRQHFLKLHLPETYRNLISMDITDDYTMGYASQVGFRAGICSPFLFYDLEMDIITSLRIHPFAVMEGTFKDYMKIEASDVMSHVKPLIDEIKAVNGTFISLWHNESLSNQGRWVGWKDAYEEMIKYAIDKS